MNRRTLLKYAGTIPFVSVSASLSAKTDDTTNENTVDGNSQTMKIQKLAWAGIRIQVGTTTVFLDASFNDGDTRLVSETDNRHAIITHHHGDHFDAEALKSVLNTGSYLICNDAVVEWMDARPFRVKTSKEYEPVFLPRVGNDIVATAVPAVDGFGHPQVSWVIEGGGKKIIHCGDTLWHGHWFDIAHAYGPFDMAFMPINGFRQIAGRYKDTGISMAMTPQQAVAAAKALEAKTICPIHYGRGDANYIEVADPEMNFKKAAAEAKIAVQIVKQGELITW